MTRARDVANLIGSGNYSSTTFTATAGQTAFTISHTQGFVQVFMNGLLLDETVDWTSDGSAVTLTSGAAAGDEIEVVAYNTFSVGDAITQTAADTRYVNASGDTMSGNLGIGVAPSSSPLHVVGSSSGGFLGGGIRINDTNHSSDFFIGGGGTGSLQIASAAGATRMVIDGSGNVTKPYQPAFSTIGTNYTQAGGAYSTVVPATMQLNVGSHYNSSTGVWTVPVAGNYLVTANGLVYPTGTGGSGYVFSTAWYKNGTQWEDFQDGEYYSNHSTICNSAIIPCAANDTLDFRLYRASVSTAAAYGSQFVMYGYLLG
mgnify:CR=1 FL=1